MNLFFGKISKEYNQSQISEGFYEAPKSSTWFGELNIEDYVYLIGGDKIQFWKAQEWRKEGDSDRLYFEILNSDLQITLNDLIALNFLQLSKALFVLTSRSSPKAFHKLELLEDLIPEQLASTAFYKQDSHYRKIKILPKGQIDIGSSDIQLYLDNNKLNLVQSNFFAVDVYNSFRDNVSYLGKGARNKDKALQIITDNLKGVILTKNEIGFRNFYDAFFCEYNERKYFLVGAFWNDHEPQDVTKLFVNENRWQNGYDDKFLDETNSIPKGSFIAIKAAYTRERTKAIMMIKARGLVTKNYKDGRNLDVEWDKNFKQFEVEFGGYMNTVKEVIDENHIEAIWGNPNEIQNPEQQDMNIELVRLLEYKKQIILQGPPGTGKTKLAKEIAESIIISSNSKTEFQNLVDSDIEKFISIGVKIPSVAENVKYLVMSVGGNKMWLRRENGNSDSTSYSTIIDFYNNKKWETEIKGNDERRAAAIAKYLFDNIKSLNKQKTLDEQLKIIQFHPSFSYEDFVRGIVAESKGDKIEYKNVNKILGLFAEMAKANWEDNKKDITSISKENKAKEYFEQFTDKISEQLADGITILKLTNSVSLVDVEEDAFRYKGNEGWTTLGNRMLFKDILQAFLDGNKVRQDIKKNKNLSGLAKQHASYFIRVVNMFEDFLTQNKFGFENLISEKVQLKNYVIIIDEINRANLSSVLGELIYALEYRDESVDSMYAVNGENKLVLPSNLYIIGTMNTADRSVGHIDYAIRRRFAFVDVLPKVLDENFDTELFKNVSQLFIKSEVNSTDNIERSEHLSEEFRPQDVWLGHSYFIQKENASKEVRMRYEIIPILEEYVKDGVLKESANKIINELKALCP